MSIAVARRRVVASPLSWLAWGFVGFFLVFMLALVAAVVVNSLGTRWLDHWLPDAFTTHWFGDAWREFGLTSVMLVTIEIAGAVVALALLIGVPASYALARRDFPGRRLVMFAFLVPLLLPPVTYGIPLATVLLRHDLGGTLAGVILANLVPSVPFVILTMTPFIEQIDPRIEAAARTLGAGTATIFVRILGPLLVPGMLAAGLLVLVRTVGMFELSFFTAGPGTEPLVVVLYYAAFAPGVRASQSIDAMAVIYMSLMLMLLVAALSFVNPTNLVARLRESP
ncbi:MAG: putative spermidine/putrescine transport system permease protein [Solirubrobacteraceae bacterium]|nr:putative spermidine/putrescine transport system permease protein [Solirubrobacteraceae bacterium]